MIWDTLLTRDDDCMSVCHISQSIILFQQLLDLDKHTVTLLLLLFN